MRSGSAPGAQGGYTYIAMLIAVAVIGVGLAATGMVWSHASQREKEQELLFIGDQFRQAIRRYYEDTPGPDKRYPQSLDELLVDQRFPKPQRHLRRIYTDPMTGKAEWGLMSAPGGGIMGVYSLSSAVPIKQTGFRERDRAIQGATNYYEWRFFYEGEQATPPATPNSAAEPPAAADAPASGAGGAGRGGVGGPASSPAPAAGVPGSNAGAPAPAPAATGAPRPAAVPPRGR